MARDDMINDFLLILYSPRLVAFTILMIWGIFAKMPFLPKAWNRALNFFIF
jgi:hypothetical protein